MEKEEILPFHSGQYICKMPAASQAYIPRQQETINPNRKLKLFN